eukprot:6195457-Pleurochrysis_carterae.AAC.2
MESDDQRGRDLRILLSEPCELYAADGGYSCQLHVLGHVLACLSRFRCGLLRHAAQVRYDLGGVIEIPPCTIDKVSAGRSRQYSGKSKWYESPFLPVRSCSCANSSTVFEKTKVQT